MDLTNEVRVGIPIEKAWDTLTDIEFIAPCMPGAQLLEVDGDEYKGQIKVKVGPITAQYQGTAQIISKDEDTHTMVVSASGRDSRGAGNAAAEIKAQMTPDGDGTAISITTTLKVTGKVAQFGRGVMGSVSEKLLGQFAESLETKLEQEGAAGATGATGATAADSGNPKSVSAAANADSDGPRKIDMPEPEPVDLLATADTTLAKRIVPIALVLVLLLLLRRRRRRRRARRANAG